MADALTAEQVGQVLTYIAPGYFARSAYTARFPQPDQPHFNVLVTSVATSLPLVAAAHGLAGQLDISTSPTHVGYVALLLGLSMVIGYLFAALREPKVVRKMLGAFGITSQPEALLTTQVLKPLKDRFVTVDFKDGRKLSGVPKGGPVLPEDGINEFYFTFPAWWDNEKEEFVDAGEDEAAVLVWIDSIHNITVSEDRTL
jgi:hypothetical protein